MLGTPQDAGLLLRRLVPGDEDQALAAHAELAADGFDFLLGYDDGEDFAAYASRLAAQEQGRELAEGFVPHTFLVAEAEGELIGRISLRHELTPMLASIGGHVGYAVRPGFRRRGLAGALLRGVLPLAARHGLDAVLVTCDDSNVASRRVIEDAGGVPDGAVELVPGHSKLRYWVPTGV